MRFAITISGVGGWAKRVGEQGASLRRTFRGHPAPWGNFSFCKTLLLVLKERMNVDTITVKLVI